MSEAKKFADLTEEEKIEWASTHTWEPRKRLRGNQLASTNRKNAAKIIKGRQSAANYYAKPEKRAKTFGDDYNARIRYLYQHNEEFRELKKFRVSMRTLRMKRDQYDYWSVLYYRDLKGKMLKNASIFKIEGTENYVNGFTIKDLKKYSPFGEALIKSLIKQEILPAPKYRGYKFKTDKLGKNVEEFYLVSEVEEYLNVFARYRKKFLLVNTDQQKTFIKKQLWTKMLSARERFDND